MRELEHVPLGNFQSRKFFSENELGKKLANQISSRLNAVRLTSELSLFFASHPGDLIIVRFELVRYARDTEQAAILRFLSTCFGISGIHSH